jgi:hypothetical protein
MVKQTHAAQKGMIMARDDAQPTAPACHSQTVNGRIVRIFFPHEHA